MNKLTKGAIAGAAGIILLMGGAGSLAYWSDSVTAGAQGQTISAGQLKFDTPVAAGNWYLNGSTTALTSAQLGNLKVVPGDTLDFKQNVTFTAQGTNLKFQASTVAGTWVAATSGNANDTALATAISSGTTTTVTGAGLTNSSGTYTITNAASSNAAVTGTVAISVTFTLPSTVAGTTGQLGNVKLNTGTGVVSLTQVA